MTILERSRAYRELNAINYSSLKAIIEGTLRTRPEDTPSLTIGSLVDTMLTMPEHLNDLYHVMDTVPGEKPKKIVDEMFEVYTANPEIMVPLNQVSNWLVELMDRYEYRGNITDVTKRIAALTKDCEAYYNERLSSFGKTIVSSDDMELASLVKSNIQTGRFTAPFHYVNNALEVHHQVVKTFTVSGIAGKIMIDKLIVNKSDDPIMLGSYVLPGKHVLAIDYKTMSGSTLNFESQMWRFKYHIQGAFYSHGLSEWLRVNQPEYQVADFAFIVESTTSPGRPIIYVMSDKDKMIGRWGAVKVNGNYVCALIGEQYDKVAADYTLDVLGFEQAIHLYKWHHEYDEWEYPREIIENNGVITTNQFK